LFPKIRFGILTYDTSGRETSLKNSRKIGLDMCGLYMKKKIAIVLFELVDESVKKEMRK